MRSPTRLRIIGGHGEIESVTTEGGSVKEGLHSASSASATEGLISYITSPVFQKPSVEKKTRKRRQPLRKNEIRIAHIGADASIVVPLHEYIPAESSVDEEDIESIIRRRTAEANNLNREKVQKLTGDGLIKRKPTPFQLETSSPVEVERELNSHSVDYARAIRDLPLIGDDESGGMAVRSDGEPTEHRKRITSCREVFRTTPKDAHHDTNQTDAPRMRTVSQFLQLDHESQDWDAQSQIHDTPVVRDQEGLCSSEASGGDERSAVRRPLRLPFSYFLNQERRHGWIAPDDFNVEDIR